ncbi:band 7 protein [Coriobacterium glomerans PW2]|uniref:Band 7 protein n=1 Tax=Coriobacterium glomerans (strain ATCC 49209 / DSM 20642 / JCM 10262 / PW2) TaxID=700015 RepID=F2NB01_CORGP|nr:SPFH domain-containing protein [Coriobacterium glomerans]AEB07679.1 band 7 protein [Coriobacterium glomerans PW2]
MSAEKKVTSASGWAMVGVLGVVLMADVAMFIWSTMRIAAHEGSHGGSSGMHTMVLIISIILFCVWTIATKGFFTVQPGQARVCVLFGKYMGTVRDEGLRWANPFFSRNLGEGSGTKLGEALATGHLFGGSDGRSTLVSVRMQTLNGERLKVNDRMGNPIEIANVVVWHVADTAKALFDVDDYESYVAMQAETALRHVASIYAYDHAEDSSDATDTITLRANVEEVSGALKRELTDRLAAAGVVVDDARLTHLAYAAEIAQAMLRRQQAEAVIAARRKIVEGAVSMVDMAVKQLSQGGTIDLDEERKAAMASNLMVVLCGESEAHPVVNTGSLY